MKQPTSGHDVTRLCFIVNLIAGALLVAAHFLPYEGWDWSLYRMSLGYAIGDGEISRRYVFLYESAGAIALGIAVVAATLALWRGWSGLSNRILDGYGLLWLMATVNYVARLIAFAGLEPPLVWVVTVAVVMTAFIVVWLFLLESRGSVRRFHWMMLILGCACLMWHAAGIAFCLVEDQMLLNYGAVVAVAGATAITLSGLFGVAMVGGSRGN